MARSLLVWQLFGVFSPSCGSFMIRARVPPACLWLMYSTVALGLYSIYRSELGELLPLLP